MKPNEPTELGEQRPPENGGLVKLFAPRTWEELFALPGISRDPVLRASMVNGTLIGDYEMEQKSGLRPCGIAECHTDHRHGYVVDLRDGIRSYVGRDCGKSQFGVEWTKMRSAFNKQKREQSKAQALKELRDELARRLDGWQSLESSVTVWARAVLLAFDDLPKMFRDTIESRAAAGDAAVIGYRPETVDEVKMRAFRENWQGKTPPPARNITYERGPLLGLPSLRRAGRVDTLLDLAVPVLHKQARLLIESDMATPDDFGKVLKRLEDIAKQVENSVRQLQSFVVPSNLALLQYLRPFEQAGVVGVHFETTSPPRFSVSMKSA